MITRAIEWTPRKDEIERSGRRQSARSVLAGMAYAALALTVVSCGNSTSNADSCNPGDNDGIAGGNTVRLVNVSDTGFAVGGVDSGSTEPNITSENLEYVTLTLTNVGTRPHDLVIECIPSGLPAGCAQTSCFPPGANVPTLQPGQSMTTPMFITPAVEGTYPFISDAPGDDTQYNPADGGVTGSLVGAFVLM
jgi:hypothetical protein